MQEQTAFTTNENSDLLFLPTLFQETMSLIFEAHDYFQFQDAIDDETTPLYLRNLIAQEMSRVTIRMTSVMAWLMARKAVSAGQLTDEDAAHSYRIDAEEECLEQPDEVAHLLPGKLNDLLEESLALYQRAWRLDQQAHYAAQGELAFA